MKKEYSIKEGEVSLTARLVEEPKRSVEIELIDSERNRTNWVIRNGSSVSEKGEYADGAKPADGGGTDIKNCQMLCKTHNRAKGNK